GPDSSATGRGRSTNGWRTAAPGGDARRSVDDVDALQHDVVVGLVDRVGVDAGDGLDHVVALGDLPEDRVLAGEVRRARHRHEELRAVRVRAGVGHGQEARLVERRTVRRDLVGEVVAGPAPAGAGGVAALDHEVGDDAVEDRPRVQRLALRRAAALIAPLAL